MASQKNWKKCAWKPSSLEALSVLKENMNSLILTFEGSFVSICFIFAEINSRTCCNINLHFF